LLVASQIPAGHIKKLSKHPMLLAIKLWAVGHLLANGELNSVLLFGSFLAYAVFDRIMVKRRGDNGPNSDIALKPLMDLVSVLLGLGVWAAIAIWLHPILFGVVAIPT
ncbi:MAG: NnrU family protein, partial [Pseudomonadota bacterium]